MSSRTSRSNGLTALAVASALFVAPVAYSGGAPSAIKQQSAAAPSKATEKHQRFIVSYAAGTKADATVRRQAFDGAAKSLGLASVSQMRTLATGAALIRTSGSLDDAGALRLAAALMAHDKSILAVEPDRIKHALLVPNDTRYGEQWDMTNGPGGINVEPAWDISTGEGIVVAVLDTGITPHSDLAGQTVAGFDFISANEDGTFVTAIDGDGRDPDPNDPGDFGPECGQPISSWHGTHVAGTIAAATNNSKGIAGVAFNAKVQPVRVLGRCGGTTADIIDAVSWASGGAVEGVPANATPAEVINLSLGGKGGCSIAEQQAYAAAIARGTTVVVAAGNSASDTELFSPANCPGVIAVSAVGPTGRLAGYSNFGAIVSVAAPGGANDGIRANNVLSTINLGSTVQAAEGYTNYAGTSMAAPHVAGIVALMQAAAPTPLTPARVKTILENTAFSENGAVSNCTSTRYCGTGIVDARKAVAVAKGLEALPANPPAPPAPAPALPLVKDQAITGITLPLDANVVYSIDVPAGATGLKFTLSGTETSGDADLYVRAGERPSVSVFDCGSFSATANELCEISSPVAGRYFVRVQAFEAVSGINLIATWNAAQTGAAPSELQVKKQRSKTAVTWTGGNAQVDVYKNGSKWKTISNSGVLYDSLRTGTTLPRYRICNANTQACSAEVTRSN